MSPHSWHTLLRTFLLDPQHPQARDPRHPVQTNWPAPHHSVPSPFLTSSARERLRHAWWGRRVATVACIFSLEISQSPKRRATLQVRAGSFRMSLPIHDEVCRQLALWGAALSGPLVHPPPPPLQCLGAFPPLPSASPDPAVVPQSQGVAAATGIAPSGAPPAFPPTAANAPWAATAGAEYGRLVALHLVPLVVALPALLRLLEVGAGARQEASTGSGPPAAPGVLAPLQAPTTLLSSSAATATEPGVGPARGDGVAPVPSGPEGPLSAALLQARWPPEQCLAFASSALVALVPWLARLPQRWAGVLATALGSGTALGPLGAGVPCPGGCSGGCPGALSRDSLSTHTHTQPHTPHTHTHTHTHTQPHTHTMLQATPPSPRDKQGA